MRRVRIVSKRLFIPRSLKPIPGITNLQAIQQVMSSQTLEYGFPFSRFSFATEINFIVISEGKKSAFFKVSSVCMWCFSRLTVLLKTDINVAVEVAESRRDGLYKLKEDINYPSLEKLDAFRKLVGGSKSGAKLKVEEYMSLVRGSTLASPLSRLTRPFSQHIENEFVQERKEDKAVTQDDLIMRITIAKSVNFSLSSVLMMLMSLVGYWRLRCTMMGSQLMSGRGRRRWMREGKTGYEDL